MIAAYGGILGAVAVRRHPDSSAETRARGGRGARGAVQDSHDLVSPASAPARRRAWGPWLVVAGLLAILAWLVFSG